MQVLRIELFLQLILLLLVLVYQVQTVAGKIFTLKIKSPLSSGDFLFPNEGE